MSGYHVAVLLEGEVAGVEEVQLGEFEHVSRDWEHYPILRFSAVPTVEVILLPRPGLSPLGAGEATSGPTPAAIANAIADATGGRVNDPL